VLYDATDLQSPGALASQGKWDEEQRQRAKEEMQRMQSGKPFVYEPHHYAWCASYTQVDRVRALDVDDTAAVMAAMDDGLAVLNPVTGELLPVYQLCAVKNPEGACENFQHVG
jgi:hypothetical protein